MFTNVSNQRNVCDQLTCSEFENRVSEKDQQEQEQSWIFSRRIGLLIKTATEVLTTRVKDRDRDTEAKAQGQSWNDGKGISLLSPWSLQPALHPPWIQTRLIRSIRLCSSDSSGRRRLLGKRICETCWSLGEIQTPWEITHKKIVTLNVG